MRIAIAVVDGVFDSGLATVTDILTAANFFSADPVPPFDYSLVSIEDQVRTGQGTLAQTTPIARLSRTPDAVLSLAVNCLSDPASILTTARSPRHRPLLQLIRETRKDGTLVGAACTGTFFLAESGVLDGQPATTSWWLGPVFRRTYPRVLLDDGLTVAETDSIITAGSAMAHIDLAMTLVARHSIRLAETVERYFLIGDHPTQSAFAMPDRLAQADPVVSAFETWTREHLSEPSSIGQAAGAIGVSERTLQRATQNVLGQSPVQFIQEIRADEAVRLLRHTDLSVETIANRVGYQSASTLRGIVRRRRGTTLKAIRSRGHDGQSSRRARVADEAVEPVQVAG